MYDNLMHNFPILIESCGEVCNVVQGYPRFLMVPQDYYCLKLTKSLHAVSRACKQFSKIYICVSQALDRKKL